MNYLESRIDYQANKIYQTLLKIAPQDSSVLSSSIRYSMLSHGKCLRGFLLVQVANSLRLNKEDSYLLAAIIEMVHTFSLVHDDLPALDNDDYRRGQISSHKKFSEATAILTGDAILTMAFSLSGKHFPEIIPAMSEKITEMIEGQSYDIENKDKRDIELSRKINRLKTGSMFALACSLPAELIKNYKISAFLQDFGYSFGELFQILDDTKDLENSADMLEYSSNLTSRIEKQLLEISNPCKDLYGILSQVVSDTASQLLFVKNI